MARRGSGSAALRAFRSVNKGAARPLKRTTRKMKVKLGRGIRSQRISKRRNPNDGSTRTLKRHRKTRRGAR